jgi:hypothetical protein
MRRSAAVPFHVFLLLMLQNDTTNGLDDVVVGMDLLEDGIFTKEREVEFEAAVLDENFSPWKADPMQDLQQQQQQQQKEQQQSLQPREDKPLEERSAVIVEEVEDDRTYLDIFGEFAKEFLTQKLIPTSDSECQWNWRHGRCEPVCLCDFQPKLGDFHLGRACRRRGLDVDETCTFEDDASSLLRFIPSPVIEHMIQIIKQRSKSIQNQLSKKLEKAYGAIQLHVCEDLHQECRTDDSGKTSDKLPSDRVFAWQERVFCKDTINDCTTGSDKKASSEV